MLSLTAHGGLVIENYISILTYSESEIKLQGRNSVVCVSGKSLCITYMAYEEIRICGHIQDIRFL